MIFLAPPVVEFADLTNNRLVFLSDRTFRLGSAAKIRMSLQPMEGAPQILTALAFLHECRQTLDGRRAYVATMLCQLPFQPVPRPCNSSPVRRDARFACHLRIVSPDLHGDSGVTMDLSRTGLQVETPHSLRVGRLLELRLKTQVADMETNAVDARVAWSRPQALNCFRSGLQFVHTTPELRCQLDRLVGYLRQREKATVGS